MDLAHLEEGHHEGLLVVRAVSAHQARRAGVDVESFNANQSPPLFTPQNLRLKATQRRGSS